MRSLLALTLIIFISVASEPFALAREISSAWPDLLDRAGRIVFPGERFGDRYRIVVFAGLGGSAEADLLKQVNKEQSLVEDSDEATLTVIFVGMGPRKATLHMTAMGWKFPWLCDPEGALISRFDLDFLPTMIVLDRDEQVLYRTTALPEGALESLLEEPAVAPETRR